MRTKVMGVAVVTRAIAVASFLIGLGLPLAEARSQGTIDADADRILRSMSSYMTALTAFTADYDVESEIIDRSGQKLQFNSSGTIVVQRPGKLYAHRKGAFADAELYFDGKTVTLFGEKMNAYVQIDSPGTIDNAIDEVRGETGLDMAGADLLYSDPQAGLLTDVESGAYLGTEVISGIECDHLAFRARQVDWQIWVESGDTPVPMKYVITSKWVTGAPQYSVRMHDWNVHPEIDAKRFEFAPAAGATKIESITANEIGEISEGAQQ